MTFNLKNDHVKNWDIQHPYEKSLFNIENEDDDQDIYISERSSLASLSDFTQTRNLVEKRLPTPTTSTIISVPQKPSHTLRYTHNELPESGIPIATQYKLQCKEEKIKKNSIRKAQPGQGNLVPVPEPKPPELGDNHYPYWYYYKVKNPDWIMRHRQTADGQIIPFESYDPSQYAPQPASTTTTLKPRQQPPPTQRKSRQQTNGPLMPPNSDRLRIESLENNSIIPPHVTAHENHEINNRRRRPSPKQYVPLKDPDYDDLHTQSNKRPTIPQRRKFKTEAEWAENYLQTLPYSKLVQDNNSPTITSNSINYRSKTRSKTSDKNSIVSDMEENGKQRQRRQQHHHPQNRSLSPSRYSPSILAQPTLHHHHHQHHPHQHQHSPSPTTHIRRRPPSGTHIPAEFHVVDMTFKKPERPSYLQQTEDFPFHSVSISNQTPHLPLIMREPRHSQHLQQVKTNTPRFPMDYYGTLARQTRIKEWEEPLEIPKVYKPDSQTYFYDHYLYNIVDKRLAA